MLHLHGQTSKNNQNSIGKAKKHPKKFVSLQKVPTFATAYGKATD